MPPRIQADENNQIRYVSSLPDQITEEDHERQSADGSIDVRCRLMFLNQTYHHADTVTVSKQLRSSRGLLRIYVYT